MAFDFGFHYVSYEKSIARKRSICGKIRRRKYSGGFNIKSKFEKHWRTNVLSLPKKVSWNNKRRQWQQQQRKYKRIKYNFHSSMKKGSIISTTFDYHRIETKLSTTSLNSSFNGISSTRLFFPPLSFPVTALL